jgi:hypothetical protein
LKLKPKHNKKLDYHELLDIVNDFMDKSGIRDFCSNTCKGRCCKNCWKTEKSCSVNEGLNKRLPCSIWLCNTFFKRISNPDAQLILKNLFTIGINIDRALVNIWSFRNKDIYFTPHKKSMVKNFIFYNKDNYLNKTFNDKNADIVKYEVKKLEKTMNVSDITPINSLFPSKYSNRPFYYFVKWF